MGTALINCNNDGTMVGSEAGSITFDSPPKHQKDPQTGLITSDDIGAWTQLDWHTFVYTSHSLFSDFNGNLVGKLKVTGKYTQSSSGDEYNGYSFYVGRSKAWRYPQRKQCRSATLCGSSAVAAAALTANLFEIDGQRSGAMSRRCPILVKRTIVPKNVNHKKEESYHEQQYETLWRTYKRNFATSKVDSSFECGNACPNTGTQLPAFLSNLKLAPLEAVLPEPVARAMLNRSISSESQSQTRPKI